MARARRRPPSGRTTPRSSAGASRDRAPRLPRSAPIRPAARRTWERFYAVVRRIPRGKVATYGQVSALAGFPRAPRLAGYALHALPEGTPLPWHRVVGAGGRLSLARLSHEGALTQRMRLEHEGVAFDARGRVRMDRHMWRAGRRARED